MRWKFVNQILWEAVGLEWGSLATWVQLRSYLEEIVEAPVLKYQEYGLRDPLCWPRDTHYPRKLALTSPTSGGRSVGIVCSQIKTTEFFGLSAPPQPFHLFGDHVWHNKHRHLWIKYNHQTHRWLCKITMMHESGGGRCTPVEIFVV
jgi:hypothetical protein